MMGESGVVSIKVMTNKFTGEPAGYGFINFDSDQTAIIAMHRMGGKVRRHRNLFVNCFSKLHFTFQIIPNSNPPVRFKLNHNSTRLAPGEVEIDWRKQNYEVVAHTFLLRLIRLSGSVISPRRWTTSLCTDTSPRDTGRCGVLRYSLTADSSQQLTFPVLSGGAGRVRVQQGIRLREVRERAGAAARPGLHDRGDGARQQTHQGWSLSHHVMVSIQPFFQTDLARYPMIMSRGIV